MFIVEGVEGGLQKANQNKQENERGFDLFVRSLEQNAQLIFEPKKNNFSTLTIYSKNMIRLCNIKFS